MCEIVSAEMMELTLRYCMPLKDQSKYASLLRVYVQVASVRERPILTCVELLHRLSAILSLFVIEESIVDEGVVADIHHRSIDFDQSSFFAVEDIVLDRVLRKAKLGIGNVAINV